MVHFAPVVPDLIFSYFLPQVVEVGRKVLLTSSVCPVFRSLFSYFLPQISGRKWAAWSASMVLFFAPCSNPSFFFARLQIGGREWASSPTVVVLFCPVFESLIFSPTFFRKLVEESGRTNEGFLL
ncbi:hypothetical protein AVEN_106315-1 [Araneus ventricosus]|uniref:Uncharacterized protein n=1 Tax=Araneus ventricosus TaxID=182803 RepID=A0A4Y2AV51_ARAVE|nr:hypothetical protein AVEN_106315-1 [Araneus ventricosus]